MNTLSQAFLYGCLLPLDFSDVPPDVRAPFEPLLPLPPQEAYEKALRQTSEVFWEALNSDEAKDLLHTQNA